MKLRYPATPLITVDPFFSIWSTANQLNADVTRHWTGKQHRITGILEIDQVPYCFMGLSEAVSMKQDLVEVDALFTKYLFSVSDTELEVSFMTPLLLNDLELCSRPVTYMEVNARSKDGEKHHYRIKILVDDEICLDHKGQWDTVFEFGDQEHYQWGRVGSVTQMFLNMSGDDHRIDWGFFYMAVEKDTISTAEITRQPSVDSVETKSGQLQMLIDFPITDAAKALITYAYDDMKGLEYFGNYLDSLWKKFGSHTILDAIDRAYGEYSVVKDRCKEFAMELHKEATVSGGKDYAELLALAYRQSIAAHKLCNDEEGKILFISKECFSNGCAATVDVSYPSVPLYLIYNPELVKGMLRPIFRYAASSDWSFDFAPHDVGQYPLLNGQVYGENKLEYQMPIEECGNMLIMMTAIAIVQKDISFANENWSLLERWAEYLQFAGFDPENQLCTDDFAGHLAHNCNLSIKAIMGLAGFSILCRMRNDEGKAEQYLSLAKDYADQWIAKAVNEDGTFRLAFDREGSFSMKYNLIWDKLWGTNIFDLSLFTEEFDSYIKRSNQFGMPLDNRADYTKSDWLLWCATLMDNKDDFRKMIAPLYAAYDNSPSRAPMTDWYDTKTSKMVGFQNRTVQGGLFIKLLLDQGLCRME